MPVGQWRPRWMSGTLPMALACLMLGGCGAVSPSEATDGPEGAEPDGTAPVPSVTPVPAEVLDLLVRFAGDGSPGDSPIHEVWGDVLADVVDEVEPPSKVVAYRPGEIPDIACADEFPAERWAGNAFYCPQDGSIAYDVTFVGGLVEAVDDSAASAILAHEWGHHIQNLTGSGEFDIQHELQADCFAGLVASVLDQQGTDAVASAESAEAFYRLGSELPSSEWFNVEEHGSQWQRYAAWSLGYLSVELGYEFCRGYDAWEPGQVANIGPYAFVQFPGRAIDHDGGDSYLLDDETLGPLTIEHVDVSGLTGTTPMELLAAWAESELEGEIGSVEFVEVVNPEELAVIHYAADADADAGVYARQGIIGLQVSPDDPEGAVIFDRPAQGTPPIEGELEGPSLEGALHALQVVLMASHRTCAPHHTQGGELETHNEMCFPDL